MKMIEDAIRSFLWGIVQLTLILSDWIYDMINTFIDIDITSSDVIIYIFTFGLLFLVSACMIRVFFLIVQKMSNDDDSFDIGLVGKRIFQMFLIIAVIPTIFTFSLGLPATINDTFNNSITLGEPMTPSTSILTSVAKTQLAGELSSMAVNDEIITVDTISEKLSEQQDGKYIYFVGYGEIFFCGIMGFLIAFSLVNIFTQIVSRWFIQIFRLFIGFIPLSSMVDPKDTSCNQWIRDIISDVLIQSWSLIALWGVFAIMDLEAISSVNGIIRLFMFWIGIASVTKLGNMIAKYIQATDLSSPNHIGSALATMGMYAVGKMSKNAIQRGAGFLGNTSLSGASAGIQQIGERMGAKSLSEMGMTNQSLHDRFVQNNQHRNNDQNFDNSINPLDASPTQTYDDSINPLEDALNNTADTSTTRSQDIPTNSNIEEQLIERQRITRPNTIARKFIDSAQTDVGLKGTVKRTAGNIGSHIYTASAIRYSNSTLRKAKDIMTKPKTLDIPNSQYNELTKNSSNRSFQSSIGSNLNIDGVSINEQENINE